MSNPMKGITAIIKIAEITTRVTTAIQHYLEQSFRARKIGRGRILNLAKSEMEPEIRPHFAKENVIDYSL